MDVTFRAVWALFLALFALEKTESATFRLEHENLKMSYINKDYFSIFNAELFQFNDTHKAYNISFKLKKDIGTTFKISMKSYIYQAKAYRKFPYELAPKVCDMFTRNDFGVRGIYEYSNFRGCPMKVNYLYSIENFNLDDSKIPKAVMIPGKFRVDASAFEKKTTYATAEWYVSVVKEK